MDIRDPFATGRIEHPSSFRTRRFLNWFPLGLSYAMLYMGRYNLTVAKNSLGSLMPKEAFGEIFGIGAMVYGLAFLLNGPLTDRLGGKKAILIGLFGATFANLGLGMYTRHVVLDPGTPATTLVLVFSALYGLNMYFQSFGAVAIVKVNASWFHVRERGSFSGIFGIMISSGIFLAFDVNGRILGAVTGTGPGGVDPTWIVFFGPALGLAAMFLVELFLLKDSPSGAGHPDILTGDASTGEEDVPISAPKLIWKIISNPIILSIAAIEFCSGVLRQAVMQWFPIYAKEQVAAGLSETWSWALHNWGLLLFFAGILGGNFAGWVSDKLFQSRRAPSAALLYGIIGIGAVVMYFGLHAPSVVVVTTFFMSLAVIGVHGLLSGTATMDFGGRKAAGTAVGLIDGAVYLGTALQAVSLGYITSSPKLGWSWWPVFMIPFAIFGLVMLFRIWKAIPSGAKEKVIPVSDAEPPASAAAG